MKKTFMKFLGLAALCCVGLSSMATTVAKIGEKEYDSLQTALNEVNGQTIVLQADVTVTEYLECKNDCILDLAGYTLTGDYSMKGQYASPILLKVTSPNSFKLISSVSGGKVTTDGCKDFTGKYYGVAIQLSMTGDATFGDENGANSDFTVYGVFNGVMISDNAKVVVNGGQFDYKQQGKTPEGAISFNFAKGSVVFYGGSASSVYGSGSVSLAQPGKALAKLTSGGQAQICDIPAEGLDLSFGPIIMAVADGQTYKVKQSSSAENKNQLKICAAENTAATVVLDGLAVDNSDTIYCDFGAGSTVSLELDNVTTLKGGIRNVGEGTLVIQDENETAGTLKITASSYCAAIGGNQVQNPEGKNITIKSGTIECEASYGAAIGGGGGENGNAVNIKILGGTVTAKSNYGAGIGGGAYGSAENVIVEGATVEASSGYGQALGNGKDGEGSTGISVACGSYNTELPQAYLKSGATQEKVGDVWVLTPPPPVAKIASVTYTSLADAHDAAVAGDEIELVDDITLQDVFVVSKKVTLNLGTFTLTAAEGKNAINLLNGCELTIKADATNPGQIVCGEGKRCLYADKLLSAGKKVVTINGGVFDGVCEFNEWGSAHAEQARASDQNCKVTINGGLFKDEVIGYRCYPFVVNGGTFEKRCEHGTTSTFYSHFAGGKFKVEPGSNNPGAIGIGIDASDKGIRISNAVWFNPEDGYFHVFAEAPAEALVKVGQTCYYMSIDDAFAHAMTTADDNRDTLTLLKGVDFGDKVLPVNLKLEAGELECTGTLYPTEGYELGFEDGIYFNFKAVAQIGETPYPTLSAAIDAAVENDVIQIVADEIEMPCWPLVGLGKKIKIVGVETGTTVTKWDCGGPTGDTKTCLSGITFENLTVAEQITFYANDTLFKDVVFTEGVMYGYVGRSGVEGQGTVTFDGCKFLASSQQYGFHFDELHDNLVVKNCEIRGTVAMSASAYSITFEGCQFAGRGENGAGKCNVNFYSDGTLKNCTFTDDYCFGGARGILMANGTEFVELEGCTLANAESAYAITDIIRRDYLGCAAFDGVKNADGKYSAGTFVTTATEKIPVAEGYIAKSLGNNVYEVLKTQVQPVEKDPEVSGGTVVDENGKEIAESTLTEEQKRKVDDAVADTKANVVKSITEDPVVAAAETKMAEAISESKNEVVVAVEEAAQKLGVEVEQVKDQIEQKITLLANGEPTEDTAQYLSINVKELETKVVVGTTTADATPTKLVYEVKPIVKTEVTSTVNGEVVTTEVEATLPNEAVRKSPVTFVLEVFDEKATRAMVKHTSEDEDFGVEVFNCPIWDDPVTGKRYITITTAHFSTFEITYSSDVVVETADTVGIVKLGTAAAGNELAAAVPFAKSGVAAATPATSATLGELVVTGSGSGDTAKLADGTAKGADDEMTPGTAFWYTSANGSGDIPLALAGLVTDPVETAVVEGSADAPVATLLVNPFASAQDIFAAVGANASEGDQITLVGGDVRYVRTAEGWGSYKKSEYLTEEGGVYVVNAFEPKVTLMVAGGKGAWYISKGGSPTVAWSAAGVSSDAEQIADGSVPSYGSLAWGVTLDVEQKNAFAPVFAQLVVYDGDTAVGTYSRQLDAGELESAKTVFFGADGWALSDATAAKFSVNLLDAAQNVIASSEKVALSDLTAGSLALTYAGSIVPTASTAVHPFSTFSVTDNGEFEHLKAVFDGFGYVTKTATGYVVTLTNDMDGVVTIADNLGNVTLDLNGHKIEGQPGTGAAGGIALAVTGYLDPGGAATALFVKDGSTLGGGIYGGDGDRGTAGSAGGAAIVVNTGVTVAISDDPSFKPTVKGGNGGIGYVTAGGAAGYAVADAAGNKVDVAGTDDSAKSGELWKAWAWCTCSEPAAEIDGTYYDGSKLWLYQRDDNTPTGAVTFVFADLSGLQDFDNAVHFLDGTFPVKTLEVGESAGNLVFLAGDAGTTLFAMPGLSVFDVVRGDEQTVCWSNLTFTSEGLEGIYDQGGRAIHLVGGSFEVANCTFANLVDGDGGAIFADFLAKDSLIVGSTFADNAAEPLTGEGGAIYAEAKGADVALAIADCSFTGNRSADGGAISVIPGSTFGGQAIALVITDTLFEGNSAFSAGGAIAGVPTKLFVDAGATKDDLGTTAFVGNSAGEFGGAIYLGGMNSDVRSSVVMRRGVRFVSNVASNDVAGSFAVGGAFDVELPNGCDFVAEGVEFSDNLASAKDDVFGGALSFLNGCAVTVDTCVFDNNDAISAAGLEWALGGAIDAENGSAVIVNSTFRNSNVEAVAIVGGTVGVTNCVAVGNGSGEICDLYFGNCTAADMAYSAYGTVDAWNCELAEVFNLTNRTDAIYDGDTLRLNPVGFNPVAALGIVQPGVFDFDGVAYGSKAYGYSMGAYETPTERLYVNLVGDRIYDGTVGSNNVTWTWSFTTESGEPAVWDDFVTADEFGTVFSLTNWAYGTKNHGDYASTNDAPMNIVAQIKGNGDTAQWYLDSGLLQFVATGTIDRRPVEMGGLTFTIDPIDYEWNGGNAVDATVVVTEKIPLGGEAYSEELTLVKGTDYTLSCTENTGYTAGALATADFLYNWIGSTNGTYKVTAYLVEYLYDDVVDASLTETIGKTGGVAVVVSEIDNQRTGYVFDLYNSPTSGVVRCADEDDGILRLKVCYYTDANENGVPDIYERKILAKVVNGGWGAANAGYRSNETLYVTLWKDGKWAKDGSGSLSGNGYTTTLPTSGNNPFDGFSTGGWLALTSSGLQNVTEPATYTFDANTVPYLIYAYSHGTATGGTGRTGRHGQTSASTAVDLLDQYSAAMSIANVTFTSGKVTLTAKAVVNGNGETIDVPLEGTTLKVYATEALGQPWSAIEATADADGNVTVDLTEKGATCGFFKVGL